MLVVQNNYRIAGQPDTFDMYWQVMSGLPPTQNTNQLFYYQVRAQQVDGELMLTICDRDGSVMGQFYCPYGCCVITLSAAMPYNEISDTNTLSFNSDDQNYYNVDATKGLLTRSSAKNLVNGIATIKITTVTGSESEIVLGEFELDAVIFASAQPIFTVAFPIPLP